jgi:zinc/manganese transport system substrate-binding protein
MATETKMHAMKKILCGMMMTVLCALGAQGAVRVASLHPMLSDMAQQVGGDAVEVVDLFPENGELHAFEPTAADLAAAAGAQMVLACGKGVEPYLEDLRDSLPESTAVIELGTAVPEVYLPGT